MCASLVGLSIVRAKRETAHVLGTHTGQSLVRAYAGRQQGGLQAHVSSLFRLRRCN